MRQMLSATSPHAHVRPTFHLTPGFGHMNDPNGLFYDELHGRYHVFAQWCSRVRNRIEAVPAVRGCDRVDG